MQLLIDNRMVKVHRVAKLTLFRDRLLRVTMRVNARNIRAVLVPI